VLIPVPKLRGMIDNLQTGHWMQEVVCGEYRILQRIHRYWCQWNYFFMYCS